MWQVSISTTAEAEEAVGCLLDRVFQKPPSVYCDEATGARSVTLYLARLPGARPAATVRARLRAELRRLRGCGLNFGPARITVKPLARENWAESWKRHFKPIDVDGILLIKPRWSRQRTRPGQHAVVLDPGLSFGTGHHPTTLFCLQRLAHCRIQGQSQSFLDIGTGSGLLAIAAAKLGYAPIEAFDYDPVAVRVSRVNVKRNRVRHLVWPQRKDLTRLGNKKARRHDVICANLAYDVLVSEASTVCARLKPGGRLIVAGILERQFGKMQKILRRFNLTLRVKKADIPWQSGEFVLRWP